MDYKFTINDFEGPLDLLLHLIRSSKMDIYTISIKKLIDEYLEFIDQMDRLNIDVTSEYLTLAAELIHLKSKMLVNEKDEEQDEIDDYTINSEDDLRNRLLEYEKIKNIKDVFKDLEEKRNEIYEKTPENISYYVENVSYDNVLSSNMLLEALENLNERLKAKKPLNTKITRKELSVEKRINDIRNILNINKKVNFLDLFDIVTKEYIVVTFLSILDMSKNNEINIYQEDNFKPIMIEKR